MRFSLAVLIVLTTLSTAYAEPSVGQPAMAIKAGRGALMFDMGGVFTSVPLSFEGIGIGGRYALRDRVHLRAAVGLDWSREKWEGTDEEYKSSAGTVGVEGGVDYILIRNANLLFYVGGILQGGFASSKPDGSADGGSSNDSSYSSLTIAGVLGANWFFTQNVSLGAEYRLGYQMATAKDDDDKVTDTRVGTGSAAFLLGFWF